MYAATALILLFAASTNVGATRRPIVTFTPGWGKIFHGESITMTCDVESTERGDLAYHWYKDNDLIHTGKSYTIHQAQDTDSGNYQCQTGTSDRSDSAKLKVQHGYVVLQAPLHVYEGDNVTLRCHHYLGYPAHQTVFSKDEDIVQDWGPESELLVENIDMKSVWRYRCTKQVKHHLIYYHHSDDVTISVQELFTYPVLRVVEGDHMTLTCETRLSPLRPTTELQFAFFRDGRSIQNFSTANRFTVPSLWTNEAASYTCQVRTLSNTVEKTSMSEELKGKSSCCSTDQIPKILLADPEAYSSRPSLVHMTWFVVLLILIAVFVGLFIFRKQIWASVHNPPQPVTGDAESGGGGLDLKPYLDHWEPYSDLQKPYDEPHKQGKVLQFEIV